MRKVIFYLLTLIVMISGCELGLDLGLDNDSHSEYKWKTSKPEDQGLDSKTIYRAFNEADQRNYINCILIVRNGYLVAERYFNGYDKNDAHNFYGASAGIISTLVGFAYYENLISSLDQKLLDFFPEYVTPEIDTRKYDISIKHLLTMKAGFDSERNNYSQIYSSTNWIKNTIGLPLVSNPGEKMRYNVFQTHLLSGILTKASGMNCKDFANAYLMESLKIDVKSWQQDPQGIYFGGNNMYFTPRDMARFGWLYLNKGQLEDEQIIPAQWVETSLSNYTGFDNRTWGELYDYNFGYLWWLGKIKNYDTFLNIGYGGQFVILIPDLNMVIVTTATSNFDYDVADEHERSILDILATYVLQSVLES